MATSNYDDVLNQLLDAGLLIRDGLLIGKMVRCRVAASDKERRGWYSLHELTKPGGDTLIVGSYGIWHGNEKNACKIRLDKKEHLTDTQLAAMRQRIAEDTKRADAERAVLAARAAERARIAWVEHCTPTGDSAYLLKKGVGGHGVRYTPMGNLVIPMLDTGGQIHGLQVIYASKGKRRRDKDFWPAGLAKKGHFFQIGTPDWIMLVAEGYATAASLHEATGYPVAVAFDAGNLLPVATALRQRYKRVRLLICGDDDYLTLSNPGITNASAAAVAVGGAWIAPNFAAVRPEDKKGPTDFNDLHQLEGLHVVRQQVEAHLLALNWRARQPKAGAAATSGGGEKPQLRPIDSLDVMLNRFVTIAGQGGAVFDRQEHMLMALSDVGDLCLNRDIFRRWKEHPERSIARVDEVGFDPSEKAPGITCNMWSGWPTTPVAGKCECLLDLLYHMCSNEKNHEDLYRWLLKWLAYPLQNPGAKMKSTVVIHGPQGTGKNLFFECVMLVYGHYGTVIDQSAIEDKFNDWASRKLFLIADEVVARSDVYHIKNALKHFVTGDRIRINPKNMKSYWETNHVNIVFLSNERMPVALEQDDRRHAVLWTPVGLDESFYKDCDAEIYAGGVAALHDYLLNIDLSGFGEHSKPPMTEAKSELIDLGLDSMQRFWKMYSAEEIGGIRPTACLPDHLYSLYRLWCSRSGLKAMPAHRLTDTIKKSKGVRYERKRTWLDGDAKESQKSFFIPEGCAPNEGEKETDWTRRSVEAFKLAMADYREKTRDLAAI